MKNLFYICLLFLAIGTTTGSAQSDKMKEKATEIVEKINNEIIAGNKHLALSETQKEQIFNLHLKRLKEVKKANKAGATKEEKKVINKKYYKEIFSEILTKHQRNARKIGKSRMNN